MKTYSNKSICDIFDEDYSDSFNNLKKSLYDHFSGSKLKSYKLLAKDIKIPENTIKKFFSSTPRDLRVKDILLISDYLGRPISELLAKNIPENLDILMLIKNICEICIDEYRKYKAELILPLNCDEDNIDNDYKNSLKYLTKFILKQRYNHPEDTKLSEFIILLDFFHSHPDSGNISSKI